jgi:hypothetical protein
MQPLRVKYISEYKTIAKPNVRVTLWLVEYQTDALQLRFGYVMLTVGRVRVCIEQHYSIDVCV